MQFPLEVRFKLLAIASQVSVTDAHGRLLFYVRQKAFRLKEAVTVFADAEQTRPLYRIAADRVLDMSARYRIENEGGMEVAVLQRRGMRSLWRAHYEIQQQGAVAFVIREENPWIKVLDSLLEGIPIVSLLAGYFLHPAYVVARGAGGDAPVLRAVKRPALFEGRFRIDALAPGDADAADAAVPGLLMMLLLERARG